METLFPRPDKATTEMEANWAVFIKQMESTKEADQSHTIVRPEIIEAMIGTMSGTAETEIEVMIIATVNTTQRERSEKGQRARKEQRD